ncbi:MAG: hypothetical protein MI864_27425, partial [Pseudomonadales bacterium]|nr:hypothetical protein [Pseudomonadales bacterium]
MGFPLASLVFPELPPTCPVFEVIEVTGFSFSKMLRRDGSQLDPEPSTLVLPVDTTGHGQGCNQSDVRIAW